MAPSFRPACTAGSSSLPAADVAVHQGPQRPAGVPALLRRDLSADPRPDRGGVDILNPVQISAVGMDPSGSRPSSAAIWSSGAAAGHPTRPARATPAQVADHVRRQMDILRRRRVRLQPGAQHPGQRPAGEHRRHVGRGAGVWRIRSRRLTQSRRVAKRLILCSALCVTFCRPSRCRQYRR